jgi:ribosomal protein S26
MRSHSTLILCDACGTAIPDEAAKEVIYQVDKLRYRLELCASCLQGEMQRRDGLRSIPGFRKRAALLFTAESADDLPRVPSTAR